MEKIKEGILGIPYASFISGGKENCQMEKRFWQPVIYDQKFHLRNHPTISQKG